MEQAQEWVTLDYYCRISGDSREAVRHRVKRGIWRAEEHVTVMLGGLWINLTAVDAWRNCISEAILQPTALAG